MRSFPMKIDLSKRSSITGKRKGRAVFHLLQCNARLDVANARNLSDDVGYKLLKFLKIGNDDAKKIIGRASHQVTLHDLATSRNRLFKSLEHGLSLLFKPDLDEYIDP